MFQTPHTSPFFSCLACLSFPLPAAKLQQVMQLLSELAREDSSIADHLTDWLGSFKETAGRKDDTHVPEDTAADADVADGAPRVDDMNVPENTAADADVADGAPRVDDMHVPEDTAAYADVADGAPCVDDAERNQDGHAGVQAAGPLSDEAQEEAELLAEQYAGQGREEEHETNVTEQVLGIPASSTFSPMQLQVLRALTSRPPMDVMAVMEADAGQSLRFHVASVMSGRVTLVVSPFRALIRNHVRTKAGEGGDAAATKRHSLRCLLASVHSFLCRHSNSGDACAMRW